MFGIPKSSVFIIIVAMIAWMALTVYPTDPGTDRQRVKTQSEHTGTPDRERTMAERDRSNAPSAEVTADVEDPKKHTPVRPHRAPHT